MNPAIQQEAAKYGNYSDWAAQQLSKGMSPQDVQQGVANAEARAKTQGSQPSWWEKLLPTVGGVLGSVAGDIIGTPLIGGAIGGGLGGALGKWGEDELTGQRGGVLSSGLSNALGGAIGGGVGDLFGSLGTDTAANIGERVAENGLLKQGAGALTRDEASNALGMGVTDLGKSAADEIPMITGNPAAETGSVLTKGVRNAITPVDEAGNSIADKIDLSGVTNQLPAIAEPHTQVLTSVDSPAQGIDTMINNSINRIAQNSEGMSPAGQFLEGDAAKGAANGFSFLRGTGNASIEGLDQADRGAVFNEAQGMQDYVRQIADAAAKDPTGKILNPAQATTVDVLGKYANALEDAASNVPLTAEDRAGLIDQLAPLKDANPKMYEAVTKALNDPNQVATWRDVSHLEAPFVKLSTAANDASRLADNAIARSGPSSKAIIQGAGNPTGLASKLVDSLTGGDAFTKGETKVGAKLAGLAGMKQGIKKGIAALVDTLAEPATNIGNELSNTGQGANMTPTALQAAGAAQGAGVPGAVPANTYASPGDINFANELNTMTALAVLDPNWYGSMASPIISAAMPTLAKTGQEQGLLNSLPGLFQNAGGAQGVGGSGILDTLLSYIPGTPQNTAIKASSNLGSKLGLPGMTPNFLQNPATQAAQIGAFQNVLNELSPQ